MKTVVLIAFFILISGCSKKVDHTHRPPPGPSSSSIIVVNIELDDAGKLITVTGAKLNSITRAQLIDPITSTVVDNLIIFLQNTHQLVLKPSKDLDLVEGNIILRLL